MPEVKVYHLEYTSKEAHMAGDMVAICWTTRMVRKVFTAPDGETYRADVQERYGKPYIRLMQVREYEGEIYEDEDSPVAGGIDIVEARRLIAELAWAIDYLEAVQN